MAKRKVIPTPELLMPGKWRKVEKDAAAVDIRKHEYYAPTDESPGSTAVRIHEYLHIKYSIAKETMLEKMYLSNTEWVNAQMQFAIGGLEDHRVNYLGVTNQEFDLKPIGGTVKTAEMVSYLSATSKINAASLYASSRFYKLHERVADALVENIRAYLPAIDKIIADLSAMPTTEFMCESARRLVNLLSEPAPPSDSDKSGESEKGEGDKSKSSGKSDGSDKKEKREKKSEEKDKERSDGGDPDERAEGEEASDDADADDDAGSDDGESSADEAEEGGKPDTKSTSIEPEPFKRSKLKTKVEDDRKAEADLSVRLKTITDYVKKTLKDKEEAAGISGTMIINNKHPMKCAGLYHGVKLKTMKKPSQFGASLKYVHRVLTDKACFAQPLRSLLGTIVVDDSGSMGLTDEDLHKVLVYSPSATIARYSGRERTGYLTILAARGKVVKTLPPSTGGGNVVDEPALEWLSRQPAPRIWICDGLVTGIGDGGNPGISARCAKIVRKAKIIQFNSVEEFVAAIEKKQMKKAKPGVMKIQGIYVVDEETGRYAK